MSICSKAYFKLRSLYWKVVSKRLKKAFEMGNCPSYQYLDECFFISKETYESMVRSGSHEVDGFWNAQTSFSVKDHFSVTYNGAYKLIFEHFLPLYSNKPSLVDIGCASGEWTLRIAPNCSSIDGYELSQKLVDTANKNASGFDNVHFYVADSKTMSLSRSYDGALILAMLMYIDNTEDFCRILKNVKDHLKPGAFLCTRDTLNNENKEVMYMYNNKTGYNAVYWSKEAYYEQFRKAGFIMIEEVILEEINTRRLEFIHIGNIWQKPI